MEGIVKLIGIIMTVAGVVCFIKPNLTKTLVDFFTKEKWIYAGAILAFIIGIILLRAASECAISWIVTLFGILALAKGIIVLVLGKQKIKSILESFTKNPSNTLRGWALLKIALGVSLIYAA